MMYQEFATALLDPGSSVPKNLLWRSGPDLHKRFAVHRNNVIASLIEALEDTFPVVLSLVGEPFFRNLAREFILQHPPHSPVMVEFGEGFDSFIQNAPSCSQVPYLSDVARLEWQRVVSLHAADQPPIAQTHINDLLNDPNKLMQSTWKLHPSTGVFRSCFSAISIWSAHQLEGTTQIEKALASVDITIPECALFLRQDLEVILVNLNMAESAFVQALLDGNSLEVAVEAAQSQNDKFELALIFSLLLKCKAFVGCSPHLTGVFTQ